MEKINFESLRQEDLTLRRRKEVTQLEQITDEEKDEVVEEVKKFIARCRQAGRYIPDEEERDFLRSILRHWGTFVYNASGVYPSVDLADLEIPAPKTRIKFSPVSLLAAGALVLLVGAVASLSALDYLSMRQTPTPIAAVQTPVISEPKLGALTPLKPGEEAGISVEVSRATGVTLTYTWIVDGGEIVRGQGSPAITYRAPDKPGTYLVRVVVKWDSQGVEKATSLKVEEEPTPTPTPLPPTDTPVPPAAAVNAIRVDQPPTIDGRLDEEIWSQAQPLTYAVHRPKNDSTTVVVGLLWDDRYLYAGFDVSDTQVEGSSATPWDGDSVSIIFDNGGQIQECRHSLLDDGCKTATTERHLKGATTFDNPDDQDEGYSIEMRIPWVRTPAEGSTIATDFLSVDHDYNPGGLFNDPGTVFSKISWDGDGSIDTAMKSILLSGQLPIPTPLPAPECPFASTIRIPIEGPPVDAEVHITSMENCADNLPTATSIPLTGTYSGDLTNKEIWILVYPPDLRYYPQSTDACANLSAQFANGQWSGIIRLGREGVPEAFHIVAVVTDIGSPASVAFHNYLTVGCTSGNYQGLLTLLPPGATELDSITVHTR